MGLALVVVEEDTRRAMHLADDHALGAVDNEGAIAGHERHVAHVDILLLDVADRARTAVLVEVPDHQAQGDLQGHGEGDAALLAFLDVVLRLLQLIVHELQFGAAGGVLDGEDRLEDLLQAQDGAIGSSAAPLQELVIGVLLHLDQVRQRCDLGNASVTLAQALTTGKRPLHGPPSFLLARPNLGAGQRGIPAAGNPIGLPPGKTGQKFLEDRPKASSGRLTASGKIRSPP